jgi:D-proline reductase (dithiol) PrdB
MARWWNRLQSVVYTRLHWINELYARAAGREVGEIPLPPLATVRSPLPEARLAVVTTAGVHLRTQEPFDMADGEGDASLRVLPTDAAPADLTITHDYYDHRAADRDINCVYPVERLRELVSRGELGSLAPRHVGMMGHLYGTQWERLNREGARRIAALFRDDAVDVALAVPG